MLRTPPPGFPFATFSCNCDAVPVPRRWRVYLEPRDLWIGVYVAERYVYFCPLPMLVIRWQR